LSLRGGVTDDLNVNTSVDQDILCDTESLSFLMMNREEVIVNIDCVIDTAKKDDIVLFEK
jgi:hypothetical protein